MLRHQGGNNTQSCQGKSQLEVQGVVHGVVQALVRQVELTFTLTANQTGLGVQHFFNAVTNSEVGAVHMTGNDEQYGDRQVVMGHVRQPQGFSLGMEATQESQNRCTCTLGSAKQVPCCIRVLGIDTPVTGEEWSQASRVRLHRQEVIPTHMLSARFGDSDVNQVTCPSQGADTEQTSQVVV
jgi:hypothetical protein